MRNLPEDRLSSDSISEVPLHNIDTVRSELLNSLLMVYTVVALPTAVCSFVRSLDVGFRGVMAFHGVAAITLGLIVIFRRRLSFQVRAFILLGLLFLAGMYGLVTWGLVGMGLLLLATCGIMAAIFVSFGQAALITVAVIAGIAVVWMGVRLGTLAFDFDVATYSVASSSWLVALVTTGFAIFIVVLPVRRLHGFMMNAIIQLDERTLELKRINARLEAEIATRITTEETLAESEAKYRALFEGSHDAIVMTSLDGKIVDANPAMLALSGYTQEELREIDVEHVYVNPEDRVRFRNAMERQGTVRDFEVKLRNKDCAERDCLLNSSLWKSDEGELLGFQTILRDVTTRKQIERELQRAHEQLEERVAERTAALTQTNLKLQREISEREQAQEALRQSEEKYRLLAENAEDVIFTLDMNLTYTYVSPSVKTLRGFDPSEVIGHAVSETLPPESLAAASRTFVEGLRLEEQGGAAPLPATRIELQMRRKDGTSVWTEVKCAFIRDAQGKPTGVLGVTRDISDRRQAEEALRKSEHQLRVIADNVPAFIAYVGMDDLRYSFVNQKFEDAFGMPRDEIIGKHIRDIIGESNYQFALKHIEQVKAGKPASYVNVFQVEQGKRWINVNYVPDFGEDGQVRAIVVLSHDITDLKRTEEDLQLKTHQLGERVKELNCLYGISKIVEKRDLGLEQTFQQVVDLIPPSWQYPEITCARITLHGQEFRTANCGETLFRQSADIIVHGEIVGSVDVGYLEQKPHVDEEAFLRDERRLIDEIAEQMGRIVERLWTEDKMRGQNEFLTLILKSLSHPFYVVNVDDYTIEMANSAAEAAGIACGTTCFLATHGRDNPCDGVEHPCPLEQVRLTKGPARVEHIHANADGSTKYVDVHGYPVLDHENRVKQMIEYCFDITEQKKAEQALNTAYHRLNQIIEFLPDPTFVIDREGRVSAWNRAIAELTGVPSEDILGKGDYAYSLPFYNERRPLLLNMALDWDDSYVHKYVSVKKHDDGVLISESYHPDLRGGIYLSGTARVLYDANGQPIEAIESLRDITDVKLAEKALKESERRLAQIIEFLPDATMVIDAQGTIIAWNQAIEKLTRVQASQILGKGDYEYALPFYGRRRPVMIDLVIDYDEDVTSAYRSVTRKGDRLVSETYLPDFQGRGPTWLWNVAAPLYDEEGRVVGAIEAIRDITDRKLAEEAVRESQEQFSLFMDMLPHTVFIKNEDGMLVYVNQYVKDLFHAERWMGKDAHAAFPDDPAEAMMADERKALQIGQVRREDLIWDKDGNERVFETTIFRISRGDKPPLLGGIGLDITDRVRARDALSRSEEQYRTLYKEAKETEELYHSLLDSTLDAIVTYDLEGHVTYVNNGFTKTFGWAKEELVDGVPYTPESEQEVTMRNVRNVIRDGEPLQDFETKRLTKDARLVDVNISASRFNDHEGHPAGMLVILRDISERKEAENELAHALETAKQLRDEAQEANRAKSAFVANISHEIRTPMNAIMGMTALALRTDISPKLRDYLTKIRTSSRSLLRIINDVLDFSRIEAGKLDVELLEFDPSSVIGNVSDLVAAGEVSQDIEFLVSIDPRVPCRLVGDPLRLEQVLTNLANNAMKFTDSGEVVVRVALVDLRSGSTTIEFSVRDTGIGIAEDLIGILFDPFTQADGSTTRRFGGSGLGLTICQRLVNMMGGAIQVRSEPGKGSVFSFQLDFEVPWELTDDRFPTPADLGGMRVLVVDDNATSRDILLETIQSFSFEAKAVASGEEALEEVIAAQSTKPYDLVLLDWKMSGIDGVETARRIDRDARLSRRVPKIIMITAFGTEEVRIRAMEAGLDGFLNKPVQPSVLIDTIMDVFGKAGPRVSKHASVKATGSSRSRESERSAHPRC